MRILRPFTKCTKRILISPEETTCIMGKGNTNRAMLFAIRNERHDMIKILNELVDHYQDYDIAALCVPLLLPGEGRNPHFAKYIMGNNQLRWWCVTEWAISTRRIRTLEWLIAEGPSTIIGTWLCEKAYRPFLLKNVVSEWIVNSGLCRCGGKYH